MFYLIIYTDRGRPNFVFFFVFGAQKTHFLFFGVFFFGRKRCTYFRCILFFGIKYGR